MAVVVNKKVRLTLVGLNGNAFALLGAFQRQAEREKWTPEEIEAVMKEARGKDYGHLLNTLCDHCDNPCSDDGEDEEDE